MCIKVDFVDDKELFYQKLKSVTLWALVTVVLVFSIIFINSCLPQPANAEEIDMNIIATIESNNNPNAYNYKSKARGLCQITPICLQEFFVFNQLPLAYLNLNYLFNPVFNFEVADWYMNIRIPQMLKYYDLQDTIAARLACYNAGIKVYFKYKYFKGSLPDKTIKYIKRYYKIKEE